MDTRVPEILIYIVIFIGLALFNYLGPRIAQWLKEKEQQQSARAPQRRADPPRQVKADSSPVAATYSPPRSATPPRRQTVTAAPTVPRSRSAVRSHLANPNNLRQAMVMMTVLGPCRTAQRDLNRQTQMRGTDEKHEPTK